MATEDSTEWRKRIAYLRSRIELHPENADLYQELGQCLHKVNDATGARQAYENAVRVDPLDPWSHLWLGHSFYCVREFDRALAEFQLAHDCEPEILMTHVCIGNAHFELGNLTDAEQSYRAAERIDPDAPEVRRKLDGWEQTARAQELRIRLDEAIEEDRVFHVIWLAEQLIDANAATFRTYMLYASNLTAAGRYNDAARALADAEALATEDQIPSILGQKARIERQRGNLHAAIDFWNKAHSLEPANAAWPIFMASAMFRSGDVEGAEKMARVATKCTTGCVDEAWFNLGSYLAAQQRYEEAWDSNEKALELDPEYEHAIARRADLLAAFPPFRSPRWRR